MTIFAYRPDGPGARRLPRARLLGAFAACVLAVPAAALAKGEVSVEDAVPPGRSAHRLAGPKLPAYVELTVRW